MIKIDNIPTILQIISIFLFILAILLGIVAQLVYGPDNKIEETVEEIIDKKTGFYLDLSPGD